MGLFEHTLPVMVLYDQLIIGELVKARMVTDRLERSYTSDKDLDVSCNRSRSVSQYIGFGIQLRRILDYMRNGLG